MYLIKKYGERVGEIVSAEVYQVWKKEVLCLDEEGNELDTYQKVNKYQLIILKKEKIQEQLLQELI